MLIPVGYTHQLKNFLSLLQKRILIIQWMYAHFVIH